MDLELELCCDGSEIDSYFESKGMNVFDRVAALNGYMGVTAVRLGRGMTVDDAYNGAKELFVSGRWKVLSR